ncbi:MAG TPA: hypothetical protein VEB86_07430 [Chryseosolibacter sp.]|nr:hypothetical protein [Chryseosolibacter sp.]
MLGGVLVLLVTGVFSFWWIGQLQAKHPSIDAIILKRLYFYHLLLFAGYYLYGQFNSSDSQYYYFKLVTDYRGPDWWSFYGTSTRFIEFAAYPFVRFFNFSYEAIMALCSFIGFAGFVYLYIMYRENIHFKHTFLGYNLMTLIFFMPTTHFFSNSLGKGSVIIFGVGLFFYAISRFRTRLFALLIGALVIYYVRPHVMLVIIVSSAIAFVFSSKNVSMSWRLFFLAISVVAFFFIYRSVFEMVGIDEEEVVSQGLDLTHRATELTKATSGIDITSYGLPLQVFTFLYRPLFFDAPGLLGLIASFENLFVLILTLKLVTRASGITFMFTGTFLTKIALLSFFTVSVALAQIAGNLGLAMRQKSQVMMLFLFVVLSYMDSEKYKQWIALRRRRLEKTPPQAYAAGTDGLKRA